MKKKLLVSLFLSIFVYAREAYAVFDIMAEVQSFIETAQNIKNEVMTYAKEIDEMKRRVQQGFDAAKNCFSNPTKCDAKALMAFGDSMKNKVNVVTEIYVMPGAERLKTADYNNEPQEDLVKEVKDKYIYKKSKKGLGKSLEKTTENRQGINAVTSNEVATLFAKGVSVKQSIFVEDGSLYQTEFKNNNLDELSHAQALVLIASQYRMSRILELRAYISGAPATAAMTEQQITEEEINE